MSDIQSSDWSEVAAENNETPPAGWPEGQAPSTVNDCAREMMGAIKREWNRTHTTVSSTGSSNAYAVAYTTAPAAYVNGLRFAFKASFANTGAATANINSLGAKDINVQTASGLSPLLGGEIQDGQHVDLEYDEAEDVLVLLNPQASSGGYTNGFAPGQQTPADMTIKVAKGSLLIRSALVAVDEQSTSTITAPVANPRNDIVYIDASTGVVGIEAGDPAVTPADPNIPEGKLPIARIRLQATTTSIENSIIDDLRQLPTPVPAAVERRQTVLSGPVDSNGGPSFGGSVGSATVTATGTLISTAANGYSPAAAGINRIGSITNPSWTGLNTNGTMYLYLDIAADGTCTTGSTTLAPVYQEGGTYSPTNGQFTFNVSEMVGKVGDGSAANQTYRVFVGQVTVASNVVSAIVWYALKGRYRGADTATLPGTSTVVNAAHNIGFKPAIKRFVVTFTTAQGNYAVGDEVDNLTTRDTAGTDMNIPCRADKLNIYASTGNSSAFIVPPANGGAALIITAANASYRFEAERGW